MNHVHEVVHNKTLEDLHQHKDGATLSTGKSGHPSKTSASNSQSSQIGLHTFFKHTEGEISPMKGCLLVHKLVGV